MKSSVNLQKALIFIIALSCMAIIQQPAVTNAAVNVWEIGQHGDMPIYTSEFFESTIPTTQGVNGWYFMFSNDINKGAAFDTSKFALCEFDNNTSLWDSWIQLPVWSAPLENIDPDLIDSPEWVTQWFEIRGMETEPDNPDDYIDGEIFGVRCDPNTWDTTKSTANNPGGGLTPAIKWVAPGGGKYKLEVSCVAGTAPYSDGWSTESAYDGVTLSIFQNKSLLYNQPTNAVWANAPDFFETYTYTKEVTMKSGDSFFFVTDANTASWGDQSYWTITITQTSADPTPTTSATSSVSSSASVSSTESSSAESSLSESSDISSTDVSSEEPTPTSKVTVVSADWGYPSSETSSEESNDDGGLFSTEFIILKIAGIIVFLSLLAFYLIRRKRNKVN